MRYVVMQAVQTLEKQGFDPEVTAVTCVHCDTVKFSTSQPSLLQVQCLVLNVISLVLTLVSLIQG